MIKRFIATIISVSFLGLSVAMLLKAAIGIGPYDAFTQTIANMFSIKIGTMTMVLNGSFLLGQVILLGKKFVKTQYLQVFVILSLGTVINIFFYDVLKFEVENYFVRLLLFISATVISGISVASIMNINFVYTALEGFLSAAAYRFNQDFLKLRWGFDIFCVVTSVTLALLFKQAILVREGTILSLLLFSPIMGFFMKLIKPIYDKWGLLPKDEDSMLEDLEDFEEIKSAN